MAGDPGHMTSSSRAGRTRNRRRRIIAASAALATVLGLLLTNAVLVDRQTAEAAGDTVLPLDGGHVRVQQDGPRGAPVLVLIHGLAGSTRWWDRLVPSLTSYRVIRIDLLGHGQSAKPVGDGYAVTDQGRRVGAALDRLGVKHAMVVGHSTGGWVATALAEQRPELVTALALIDTGPASTPSSRTVSPGNSCSLRSSASCCGGYGPTACSARPRARRSADLASRFPSTSSTTYAE